MKYIYKIVRIMQWLPVLWNDEDWDFGYLISIIKYKVERMARHHKRHHIIAHWSHIVNEMDMFRHLCELHSDDADDEWTMWYNAHPTGNDIDSPVTPEQRKALDLSSKREKRNWHNIWAHLDKHAQGWWD